MPPGPPPRLHRQRARDSKTFDYIAVDGVRRGPDLPADALADGEEWHPMVVRWWEAFRTSPQARLITSEVQWQTLAGAMRTLNDFWTGPARGRSLRAAEFRAICSQYLVTPADARRAGVEFVMAEDGETDDADADVVRLSELTSARRKRLVENDG